MSVINQMLRDLEDRKQPSQQIAQPQFHAPKPAKVLPRLLLVVVLLVGAAAIWWFGFASSEQNQVTVKPAPTLAQPAQVQSHAKVIEQAQSSAVIKETPEEVEKPKPQSSIQQEPLLEADIEAPAQQQPAAPKQPPQHADHPVNMTAQVPESQLRTEGSSEQPQHPPQQPKRTNKTEVSHTDPPAMPASTNKTVDPQQPISKGSATITHSAMSAEESASLQLKEARSFAANGRSNDAEHAYQALLQRNPTMTSARLELVALLTAQQQSSKAIQVLNEGLRFQPSNAQLTTLKAQLLLGLNRTDDAWAVLQGLDESQVQDTGFFVIKAGLASQRSEFDVAYRNYVQLTALEPTQARWWLGKAISAEQLGKTADAIDGYRRALTRSGLSAGTTRYAQHRLDLLGTKTNGAD